MERLLYIIPRVVSYFDDVLITASNEQQLFSRLWEVSTKFCAAGLRAKSSKCQIGVEFLGYRIAGEGIHPMKSKIRVIQEAPTPTNQTELKAFLGLLNFYSIFLKNKATITDPLHRLLAKQCPWVWGRKEAAAFQQSNDCSQLFPDPIQWLFAPCLGLRRFPLWCGDNLQPQSPKWK